MAIFPTFAPRFRSREDRYSAAPTRLESTVGLHTVFKSASIIILIHLSSAMYYVLVILLHRPFVADGHLYSTQRSVSVSAFLACADAASSIVRLLRKYDRVFSVRHAPYLISYATYVAATILVRIASKPGHDLDAIGYLETCLAVFSKNQATNWAVKRANAVIRSLMKKLGVVITEGSSGLQVDKEDGWSSQGSTLVRGDSSQDASTAMAQGPVDLETQADIAPDLPSLSSSGWLDIDGIIQSFLRDPDMGTNQDDDATWVSTERGIMGEDPQHTSQVLQSSNDLLRGRVGDTSGLTKEVQRMSPIDDLLFGFSGSALDNYL